MSQKVINYRCGSLFTVTPQQPEINVRRGESILGSLLNPYPVNKQLSIDIFDFRLLDALMEEKCWNLHTQAMHKAAAHLSQSLGITLNYVAIHVPTSNKIPHFHHTSLSHNSQTIGAFKLQFYGLKQSIASKIKQLTTSSAAKPLVKPLKDIFTTLVTWLETPSLNAASGVVCDSLASILCEHLPQVKVLVGCKSAKDRTTCELITMNAIRTLILSRINQEQPLNLEQLVTGNKLNLKHLSLDEAVLFLRTYDDKLLYQANLDNNGHWANVNSKTMLSEVLHDLKDVSCIKQVYSYNVGN
jgi:hypothetical protein